MDGIVEVKAGDEIEVDRAKLTDAAVFVRRSGIWIELRPPRLQEAEIEKNTAAVRAAFNKICKDANVHQGTGPPTAYFQTAPNGEGAIMRCIYESFGMDGPHDEGELVPGDKDFEEVLRSSIETFKQWLKPNCTLVWRHRPEVRLVGTYWSVYYRCVQLDDDARKLAIDWQF